MQARILTGGSLDEIMAQIFDAQSVRTDMTSADQLALHALGMNPDGASSICNLLGGAVILSFCSRAPEATFEDVLQMLQSDLLLAIEDVMRNLDQPFHDKDAPAVVKANPLKGTRTASLISGMHTGPDQVAPFSHDDLVAFMKGPMKVASAESEAAAEATMARKQAEAEAAGEVKH